ICVPAASACSWSAGPRSYPATPSGAPGKSSIWAIVRSDPSGWVLSTIVERPCRAANRPAVSPAGLESATRTSHSLTAGSRSVPAALTGSHRLRRFRPGPRRVLAEPLERGASLGQKVEQHERVHGVRDELEGGRHPGGHGGLRESL